MKHTDSLSVVIPVYNSESSLLPLLERLASVLETLADDYEVILVNDGSRDASWEVIQSLAEPYPFVQGINLMRNYGQHNALLCGIRAVQYDVVVTLDDDLQHPPEEIPKLLIKLREGHDVVYGVPHRGPHKWWRNLFSRTAKMLLAKAMDIRNVRDISAFRAFRTEIRKAFTDYQSPTLLLDALLAWGTTRFAVVHVRHDPRTIGHSNYTFLKLINQTMLILTGFSTGPLRLASIIGFVFTCVGVLVLIYVVGRFLIEGRSVPGFAFLASIMVIFAGAQLFAIGIIGEYLGRVFDRSTERPTYVVKDVVDFTHSSVENHD